MICPGFAVDCLETLEEIAEENAGIFREAGGENFAYIHCLNDRKEHSAALADLLRNELLAWFSDEPSRSDTPG